MQQKIRLHIDGMDCQACATRIEKVLKRKPGIASAEVNFAGEEAQVVYDDAVESSAAVLEAVRKAGFDGKEVEDGVPEEQTPVRPSLRLMLEWLAALPFFIGMAGMMTGHHQWMMPPWWQFAVATFVQFGLAWPFYRGAWASIKGGLANMDVLVSAGTLATWAYSSYMLFKLGAGGVHDHLYFEAGVMVIAFVSLGKYLETRTKKQSLNSMGALIKLTPATVRRREGGQWAEIPAADMKVGDELQCSQGMRAAADGVVIEGEAWFDESHLTGESAPLLKKAGDKVMAGALNTGGSTVYRVTALGKKTLLGDMMAALAQAQGSKAPIARLADKVSAVFVPAVLAVAVLTFMVNVLWFASPEEALTRAVAVLVIACPCALGLATPAAIMVGMGKAARYGIWFKDAASLETAGRADTVVLDKTGTLTTGKPQVTAVRLMQADVDEKTLWAAAAAVEQHVVHPLADAVTSGARARNTALPAARNVHNEVGQGAQADVEGIGSVKVGRPDFCGFGLPENLAGDAAWQEAGIVAVSANGKPLGLFAVADALKDDSAEGVRRLQHLGMKVVIMSGDRAPVVEAVARSLNIDTFFSEMTPRDKAQQIAGLRAQENVVVMVGDGLNDTPALAAADVGFAMYSAADAVAHSAGAVLMRHSVNQAADAAVLARDTVRNIRQNLFFAFFYNILGIPLAAIGLLSPVVAGAAMALSSVSVLGNALRLRRSRLKG